MIVYEHLWANNPSIFLAVEQTRYLAFETIEDILSIVKMDKVGNFDLSQIHPKSSYFRYRTTTRFVSREGKENFFTKYEPPLNLKWHPIGVECSLEDALSRTYDNFIRAAMLRHPLARYYISPSGYAWNLYAGDQLHDPGEFGLVIPPVESRALED